MESEHNTLEKLSAVSDVKMSSHKQQEIWDDIEKEIDQMKPVRTKHRRSSLWGTGAAAVAAVALVAGGFYALANHSPNPAAHHNVTTASQPTFIAPSASSLASIKITSYGSNAGTWVTYDPKSVAQQVVGWLSTATPVKTNNLQSNTAANSLEMEMTTTDKSEITIFPAYTAQGTPVKDVVAYKTNKAIVYVSCPQLYSFLVKAQYPTEFAPQNWNPTPLYIDAQGHTLEMTAQMVGLKTVFVPSGTQETGNLINVRGNASLKTLSFTFSHVNINESTQPLTGGGIVTKKNTVTLANGVKAQWITVTGHTNTTWVLEFKRGSVYISLSSTDNALSKNQIQQIASSMVSIQP